jgi:hypothetical protein
LELREARARSPVRAPFGGAARDDLGRNFALNFRRTAPGLPRGGHAQSSPVAMAPEVSSKVASVAISTIGSFFG